MQRKVAHLLRRNPTRPTGVLRVDRLKDRLFGDIGNCRRVTPPTRAGRPVDDPLRNDVLGKRPNSSSATRTWRRQTSAYHASSVTFGEAMRDGAPGDGTMKRSGGPDSPVPPTHCGS